VSVWSFKASALQLLVQQRTGGCRP